MPDGVSLEGESSEENRGDSLIVASKVEVSGEA